MSSSGRVVVTGVSRGIGRATALAFAAQGARVAGLHLDDPEVGARLEAELRAAGAPDAHVVTGSTASARDVDGLAATVAERWGGLDVWVSCAARLVVKPFLETSDDDWSDLLDVNLLGYVRGARAAARLMVPAGSGRIISIGSVVEKQPPTQMTAYVAAKGAVSGLTRALAVELGPSGVTVNAVNPGATETPLNTSTWTDAVRQTYRERIPLARIAEPEDVADAVVLLAGDGARYITGQVVDVDGGLTINGSVGHRPV